MEPYNASPVPCPYCRAVPGERHHPVAPEGGAA